MQSVLGKSVGSAPLSVTYGVHAVSDGAELSKAQVGYGGVCQAVPCSLKLQLAFQPQLVLPVQQHKHAYSGIPGVCGNHP